MGIAKKTDGRYIVGIGVTDANDYKGSAAYRDIFIQLTESGASDKSLDYLNYLKDYAIYHNSLGEPIMPPSVNVWISNHGVTTAVEADDLSLDGSNYTIGGIKWDGSAWDYTNAGQEGGGGGGGSNLPSYTSADIGKVLTVDAGEGQFLPAEDFIPSQVLNFEDAGALLEQIMVDEDTFQQVTGATYSVEGRVNTLIPNTTPQGVHVLVSEDNNIAIGYFERFGGWLITDESLSDGAHAISVSAILEGTPELAWKGAGVGIPESPTEDGNYVLRILNGVASWVSRSE